MIRKLTLVAGFGAGYVLGAKAGTSRYDQIMGKARELAGQPAVKDATSTLQQSASTLADRARDTVNEKVSTVSGKVPSGSSSSSATPSAAYPPAVDLDATSPLAGSTSPGLGADLDLDTDIETGLDSGLDTGLDTGLDSGTAAGTASTPYPGAAASVTAPDVTYPRP